MIDIGIETLITLSEAARLRPAGRLGRPTHVSTILRWITRGTRGARLEAVRLGGSIYTSREALQRFADRLSTDLVEPTVPAPRAGRERASKQVEAELRRIGI